jgi:hypothetical protein
MMHSSINYRSIVYGIPHVVLSPNAHRPSPIAGSKGLQYDCPKGDGRWAMVLKSVQYEGGVFLYPVK